MVTLDTASVFLLAPQCARETADGKHGVKAHLPLGMEEQCSFGVNRETQFTH